MPRTTIIISMLAIFLVGGLIGYLIAGSDASTMLGGIKTSNNTQNRISEFVNNDKAKSEAQKQGFEIPEDLKMITVNYYQNTEDISSADFIEKLEMAGKNPKVYGMEIIQYENGVEQNRKDGSNIRIHNPNTCNWLPLL